MRVLLQVVALGIAFLAGIIAHSLWSPVNVDGIPSQNTVQSLFPEIARGTEDSGKVSRDTDRANADGTTRVLQLQTSVVDALLAGGGQSSQISSRRLSRMGLSDDQIEAVSAIKVEKIEAFKIIEKAHAEVVSGDDGDYVAIAPFPEERRRWLEDIEVELREMLSDDRASVIARMIAFSDNDEDIGVYRREISVIEAEVEKDGQRLRVEEKIFNHDGQHIDSDYDLVGPQSRNRWGHLLDLGEE